MFSAKSTEFKNLKGSEIHAYEMHAPARRVFRDVHLMNVYLFMGVSLIGVYLISVRLITHGRASHRVCISGVHPYRRVSS